MTTAYGPLAADEAKLRWHEPYVSEAINKKASAESYGVVRGFELQTDAGGADPKKFRIAVSSFHGDSVACVRDLNDGRTMTVNVATPIDVDLTALVLPANVYYVCLFVNYTLGAVTQVTVEVLTAAQMLNVLYAGKLVILGVLVYDGVTALDTDPAPPNQATIRVGVNALGATLYRQYAQLQESDYRVQWQRGNFDGSFDSGHDPTSEKLGISGDESMEWWDLLSAGVDLDRVTTDPLKGRFHASASVPVASAVQWIQKHATPIHDGDVIAWTCSYKKVSLNPAGSVVIQAGALLVDGSGNVLSTYPSGSGRTVNVVTVPAGSAAMTSYGTMNGVFRIPAGWDIWFMVPVLHVINNDAGVVQTIYFDEFYVQVMNDRVNRQQRDEDVVGAIKCSTKEYITGLSESGGVITPFPWSKHVAGSVGDLRIWNMNSDVNVKRTALLHANVGILPSQDLDYGPAPSRVRRQALYRQNTVRAHCNFTDPLGVGAGPCTVHDEFGIVSVVRPGGVGLYDVTFHQAWSPAGDISWMNAANYTVLLATEQDVMAPGKYVAHVVLGSKTVSGFQIAVYILGGAVYADPPVGTTFHFEVLGD